MDADPRLGRPLCPDCYDYTAAVLFNANAAELWRRFTTYLPRRLAALAGVTAAQLRAEARIRYVKVAEYQARGVVHFHAVIRLDAPGDTYQPPPGRYITGLLSDAIAQAAAAAYVTADRGDCSGTVLLRFGTRPTPGRSAAAPTGRSPPRPSPTTSVSTPPRASTRPACPPGRSAASPTFIASPAAATASR